MRESTSESFEVFLISSIPKSGTHQLGLVLEDVGIHNNRLFLNPESALVEDPYTFGRNRARSSLYSKGRPFSLIIL